jgi:hypothetical protein
MRTEPSDEEPGSDALDRGEVDAAAAQKRVDASLEDGDHDDNRDGVQVLDEIVRRACENELSASASGR